MRPRLHSAGRHRLYLVGFILLLVLIVALAIGACGDDKSPAAGGSAAESAAAATAESSREPGPATTLTFAEDVTIEPGARKALVKRLQRALPELGFDPGPADGIYGPRTTKAVRAFQRNAGLEATGTVDQETVRALNEALAGLRG